MKKLTVSRQGVLTARTVRVKTPYRRSPVVRGIGSVMDLGGTGFRFVSVSKTFPGFEADVKALRSDFEKPLQEAGYVLPAQALSSRSVPKLAR